MFCSFLIERKCKTKHNFFRGPELGSEVRQPRKHPFALGGIVPVVGLQSNGKTIREVVVFGVFLYVSSAGHSRTSLSCSEEQGSPHPYTLMCRYLRAGGRSAA
eukprot:scaffold141291_cov142-Phaeocystis_antarctica.AAC.1